MSVFLISSSLVCTILIPENEFQPGGKANGRALAYLGHDYLGSGFGTVYDISTILILWFAGASAMAGLAPSVASAAAMASAAGESFRITSSLP